MLESFKSLGLRLGCGRADRRTYFSEVGAYIGQPVMRQERWKHQMYVISPVKSRAENKQQ